MVQAACCHQMTGNSSNGTALTLRRRNLCSSGTRSSVMLTSLVTLAQRSVLQGMTTSDTTSADLTARRSVDRDGKENIVQKVCLLW